jgi:hypothetical protein
LTKATKLKQQSHERRHTIKPLTHWLEKTFDEKRDTPKTQGLTKSQSMKKEATPKMQGANKKTSSEKRGNP